LSNAADNELVNSLHFPTSSKVAQRDFIEGMTGRLVPDFKTIADFRTDWNNAGSIF
jgi:hypothetical protein